MLHAPGPVGEGGALADAARQVGDGRRGATRWRRWAWPAAVRSERPALGAALQVGVDERRVDARVLAVEPGRDRLAPAVRTPRLNRVVAAGAAVPVGFRPVAAGHHGAVDGLQRYADAAREGDDVAVGELVRLTQPAVWQVCAALGSAGEVEDLVQETYLRALRALPGYRGDAPVRVWLLSIARRVCADHVRRRQRRRRLVDRLTRARAAPDVGRPRSSTTCSRARPRPPRGVRADPARRAQLRGGGGRRRTARSARSARASHGPGPTSSSPSRRAAGALMDPPAVPPDDKDWTWVLQQRVPGVRPWRPVESTRRTCRR